MEKQIKEIFFLPPLAIARLGGSDTPLPSFEWASDRTAEGIQTVIRPSVTLDVLGDGSLRPYVPNQIQFRDGDLLRPVAPFFELWAIVESDGKAREPEQLTLTLLQELHIWTDSIEYTITVANRKAQRRTGKASCAYIARASASASDYERKKLLAFSPHNPGEEPLVFAEHPIPLGYFQAIRPVPTRAMGVDLSALRVRFTPAQGEVYGPPTAVAAPASPVQQGDALPPVTLGGKLHEIVPARNRILNGKAAWSHYVMNAHGQADPQPSDSYDGANVGNNRSWGVVDDTCDGIIEACLVIGGRRFVATARVLSTCPDFAPDRRPFFSLADDLADRDLREIRMDDDDGAMKLEAEIGDLFERVFETVSLVNLDSTRNRGIYDNGPGNKNYKGLPKVDERTMTKDDKPYVKHVALLQPNPADGDAQGRLSLTDVAHGAHGPLADIETLLDFLRANEQHVKRLLRPPFGRFRQLKQQNPGQVPDQHFRDPRVDRDTIHDMRMPPYMRDSDASALSLTWRQYDAIMKFLEHAKSAARTGKGTSRRDSPLAREVMQFAQRFQGGPRKK